MRKAKREMCEGRDKKVVYVDELYRDLNTAIA